MDVVEISAILTAIISLGVACYALISQRKHDKLSVAPIGQFFGEGFLHRVSYGIENVGLGPLKIKKIEFVNDLSNEKATRIVDLFPDLPEGYYYRGRTDNVVGMTVPKDRRVFFFEMEGGIKDDSFIKFRDEIEDRLKNISVHMTYTDMYLQEYDLRKKIKWGSKS